MAENGLLTRRPVLNGLLGLGEPARMNPNLQAQGRNALASALRGTPSPFLDPEFYKRDLGPSAASYFSEPENALRALSVAPVPVLSDVAGLAADALMYKNKPESRNMLNFGLTGLGALPFLPALAGMTAYHGSPYKFDKFDAAHIGKGEGAQAYGHGVYFAENPKTALSYKNDLATQIDAGGSTLLQNNKRVGTTGNSSVDDLLIAHYGDVDEAIKFVKSAMKDGRASRREYAPELAMLESLKPTIKAQNTGSLYKVDIPDEYIPRMLDWDKPLSQQPKSVQDFFEPLAAPIRKQMAAPAGAGWGELAAPQKYDPTGQELLGLLRQRGDLTANGVLNNGLGPEVSARLRAAGIPGIRYLDGGSRGTGQGTSNFVVFPGNEGAVKILERK